MPGKNGYEVAQLHQAVAAAGAHSRRPADRRVRAGRSGARRRGRLRRRAREAVRAAAGDRPRQGTAGAIRRARSAMPRAAGGHRRRRRRSEQSVARRPPRIGADPDGRRDRRRGSTTCRRRRRLDDYFDTLDRGPFVRIRRRATPTNWTGSAASATRRCTPGTTCPAVPRRHLARTRSDELLRTRRRRPDACRRVAIDAGRALKPLSCQRHRRLVRSSSRCRSNRLRHRRPRRRRRSRRRRIRRRFPRWPTRSPRCSPRSRATPSPAIAACGRRRRRRPPR